MYGYAIPLSFAMALVLILIITIYVYMATDKWPGESLPIFMTISSLTMVALATGAGYTAWKTYKNYVPDGYYSM